MTRPQFRYFIHSMDVWNDKNPVDPEKEKESNPDTIWKDNTVARLTKMMNTKSSELFG